MYDESGTQLCNEINYGPPEMNEITLSEPHCHFVDLMEVTTEIKSTLENMKAGHFPGEVRR